LAPPPGAGRRTNNLFGPGGDLRERVKSAVARTREFLFAAQQEDGYWCGELEADTTLESDYILLHTLLGTGRQERIAKAAREILRHQNEDGGWAIYHGGPSQISASVKAYFSLKLAGYLPDHPALARARRRILELGGVTEVNTFTKIYLCFLGQYDYDAVPAIPPEIVLFPRWPTPRSRLRKLRPSWVWTSCLWGERTAPACTSSGIPGCSAGGIFSFCSTA